MSEAFKTALLGVLSIGLMAKNIEAGHTTLAFIGGGFAVVWFILALVEVFEGAAK